MSRTGHLLVRRPGWCFRPSGSGITAGSRGGSTPLPLPFGERHSPEVQGLATDGRQGSPASPLSSRGLGRRPLTAETRVRIPVAVLQEAPTCRGFRRFERANGIVHGIVESPQRRNRWPARPRIRGGLGHLRLPDRVARPVNREDDSETVWVRWSLGEGGSKVSGKPLGGPRPRPASLG